MPRIICHMIASVDGRLYPSRWTPGPESADITTVYETAASQFNAAGWMVGRTTMAEYADGIVEKEPAALRTDGSVPDPHTGNREGRPIAVVFDPKGKLHYPDSTLPTGEHLVAVLSPEVGDGYLAELRDRGVSYVFSSVIGYRGAPGERPAQGQRLEHIATETFPGGVVWLRYSVRKA